MKNETLTYLVIIMITLQIVTMMRIKRDYQLVYERDAYSAKAENWKNDDAIRSRNDMYEAHNLSYRDHAVEVPK